MQTFNIAMYTLTNLKHILHFFRSEYVCYLVAFSCSLVMTEIEKKQLMWN
jgi:hypothetical protein